MNREKIKTLTLVFLILMSVVLLLLNINASSRIIDFKKVYMKSGINNYLNYIIKPQRILVHFGGGNNTEVLEGKNVFWSECKKILKENISKTSKVDKIDSKEYKIKKSIKSIEIKFEKGIDGYFLAKSLYLKDSPINKFKRIYEILIPLVDDSSIYFSVGEKEVYKINTKSIGVVKAVDSIEKKDYAKYYTIDYIFGIDNETLIPMEIQEKYNTIGAVNYLDVYDDRYIQSFAQNVFGKKYDFTNRIVEGDFTNLFLYGYGEKSLRIDSNGHVEYFSDNSKQQDVDKDRALDIAINFLEHIKINIENISLVDSKESKSENKRVYEFSFLYEIENLNVQTKFEYPINIKIVGEDVYSYKGIVKNPTTSIEENTNDKMLTPQEILNMNFNLFKETLNYSAGGEEVLENLESIEIVYFLKDKKFIPSWRFLVQGKEYIFDAHKGAVLKYGLGKS